MFVIIWQIVVVFNDEFVLPIIIKICKVLGEFILWCTQKNYHNLTIFDIYSSTMHHGEYLENILWWKFAMDDGICSIL
jgi:hypothetical protein